jgi:hypothetical protein
MQHPITQTLARWALPWLACLRWLTLIAAMLGAANPALAAKTYSDNGDGIGMDKQKNWAYHGLSRFCVHRVKWTPVSRQFFS